MKKLITGFAISAVLAAQAQASQPLPNYLKQKLDENAAGTAAQLMVMDTLQVMEKDAKYRQDVTKEVRRDLKGWEPYAEVAMGASAGLTLVGGGSLFAGSSLQGVPLNPRSASVGITHADDLSSAGAGSILGGLAGFFYTNTIVLHTKEVKNLLNETEADKYAENTSKMIGRMFQLSKGKESALKFAIKEEIYSKDKAKSHDPIDLVAVMLKTKHMGKNVFSEEERAAFAELHAALLKAPEAQTRAISDDERIGFLMSSNSMLEVQHKMMDKAKQDREKMGKVARQIDLNNRLIQEIHDFRSSQDPESVKKEDKKEDKEEGEAPAE